MFTESDVRALAEFPADGYLLTSLYLQSPKLANRSHRDEIIQIKDLFKGARRQWENKQLPREKMESLEHDARLILEHLGRTAPNGGGRDRAVFACSGKSFFRAIRLPGGVQTGVKVGEMFSLRPLVALLDEYPRHCVIMINRERAQIYERVLGETEDENNIQHGVPQHVRGAGWGGYGERQIERHVDQELQRHYQRVADALMEMYKRYHFERLVLAGHRETFVEFEKELHADLKKRVIGRFVVDPASATGDEVRAKALDLLREYAQAEKQRLAEDLLTNAGKQAKGVVGLEATLGALSKREVMTLVVGQDLYAGGKRCRHCGFLGGVTPKECPQCSEPLEAVDDVVDYAVSQALLEDSRIRFMSGNPAFKEAGNIGALLRYRSDSRP